MGIEQDGDGGLTRRRVLAAAPALVAAAGLAAAAPAEAQDGVIPIEGLKPLLVNLGFEPEELMGEKDPYYRIRFKQDPFTFVVDVSLSSSRAYFWLVMRLAEIPDPAKAPAAALMKLLVLSDTQGPNYYSVSEKPAIIFLNRPLENRGLTPARIRKTLDELAGAAKKDADAWDPSKW